MIEYPKDFVKKPIEINAYGQKVSTVNYQQKISGQGFKHVGNIDYVRGYRDAIKDIKNLNNGGLR